MKKIHNRQSANMFNEYSYKMNNWKEAKFSSTESSFKTKKRFNNIVNMNLMSSKDESFNKSKVDYNKYITKSMKFYNKTYEELLRENLSNRFDSITLKSIKNKGNRKQI